MRRVGVLLAFAPALVACSPAESPADASLDGAAASMDAGSLADAAPATDDAAALLVSCTADVCSGTLDPVALGPGIEPVVGTRADTGEPGSHWFCRPRDPARWNGRVVIHLVGTWSNPADDHRFPERACAIGFAAITPMYENRAPARETCGDDGPCYEAHRREIVDGIEGAPEPVEVDVANSVRNRVSTTLARLAAGEGAPWASIRDRLAADDWTAVVLSGHSQGSGHALYLAREEAADRVVLLAGPSDRLGDRTPSSAPVPWIEALGTMPPRTLRVLGYIHDDDTIQVVDQVLDNWSSIGVPDGTCQYVETGDYESSCRRIRIPPDGCDGQSAHSTVVVRRWGPACALGMAGHTNEATWDWLLTVE